MFKILNPKSEDDFEEYLKLRWVLLRRPWGGKRGSEKDHHEETSFHRAAANRNNKIIGVGRIHFIENVAQIRYMAVKKSYWGNGIGSKIIIELEKIAKKNKIFDIFLNSRESSVGFYEKHGFSIIKIVDSSFGDIIHYRMEKKLNN